MSPIRQSGQISEFHIFAPPNAAPCTVLPGRMPLFVPLPAATICCASDRQTVIAIYMVLLIIKNHKIHMTKNRNPP